jgi:hypothetical protein
MYNLINSDQPIILSVSTLVYCGIFRIVSEVRHCRDHEPASADFKRDVAETTFLKYQSACIARCVVQHI